VIREISRSKIRNRMAIIKKLVENGIFIVDFSLNPHSKFTFVVLNTLLMFMFINIVMINIRFEIAIVVIIRLTVWINFYVFLIGN